MKKYIPLTNGQELEVELTYHREGRRGYYLWVMPVTREDGTIAVEPLLSEFQLVKEVTRKSAKAEREAIEAAKDHEADLIAKVLEKYGLTLLEAVGT